MLPSRAKNDAGELVEIEGVCHDTSPLSLRRDSQRAYIVLSHDELLVKTKSGRKRATIISVLDDRRITGHPNSDVLLCFKPELGQAAVGYRAITPSVVFWRGKFWVPFLEVRPPLRCIADTLQLGHTTFELDGTNVDIIHEIHMDLTDIPDIDWNTFTV